MDGEGERRPLRSRQTGWAAKALALLLKTPLSANQVSFAGVVAAVLGALAILAAPTHPWLWLVGAAAIQLRLMANMMDGLVAVEGGRGSPTGAIWNEAPDRLEDTLFLVAFGYAAGVGWLGWLAAILALGTAYARALGGALHLPQDFRGPMAKPHRMAALTLGCLLAALEAWAVGGLWLAVATLALIAVGTAATLALRLIRQGRALKARAAGEERREDAAP